MFFKTFNGFNQMIFLVFYLKMVMSLGHRPVVVKRALIGLKGVEAQHNSYVEKCFVIGQ